jgi:hypothetical protein
MSEPKSGQEPSMEEILASIRRIISDDVAGRVPPRPTADDGDVLELTEVMNDDGTVTRIEPAAAALASSSRPTEAKAPARSRIHVTAARPSAKEAKTERDDAAERREPAPAEAGAAGAVLSDGAASGVAGSFGSLANAVGGTRDVPLGSGGKTLETLVKELLQPLLKDWLDENLPALVERLVQREIHRISGRADKP